MTINTAPDCILWDIHGGSAGTVGSTMRWANWHLDQMVSTLIEDLYERGLDKKVLVLVWGEFGRTPVSQNADGRDHNPWGFTMWMAGGGVKPGVSFGETDEYGFYATRDKVHFHDLHATILHLLGLDHDKLTYRYAGRNFRLTDIHGRVVHEIIN